MQRAHRVRNGFCNRHELRRHARLCKDKATSKILTCSAGRTHRVRHPNSSRVTRVYHPRSRFQALEYFDSVAGGRLQPDRTLRRAATAAANDASFSWCSELDSSPSRSSAPSSCALDGHRAVCCSDDECFGAAPSPQPHPARARRRSGRRARPGHEEAQSLDLDG